jgi:hypothetical protein
MLYMPHKEWHDCQTRRKHDKCMRKFKRPTDQLCRSAQGQARFVRTRRKVRLDQLAENIIASERASWFKAS